MKTAHPALLKPSFLCALLSATIATSYAGSATWILNPATGDWNTPAN